MTIFTRRSFLETAVGAAAAAGLGARSARAAGTMFVSLNGALTAGKNVGWPEFARLAARVGFGGVDWSLGPVKAAGLDASKALLAELKLKPTITGLPTQTGGRVDDAAFQASLRPLAEDAQFAAALGCTKMMQTLPTTSPVAKAEYRKVYRDRIVAIAEVLQRSNVRLGLEFLGVQQFRRPGAIEFIWRMDEAVEFAKECGSNVGVVLDVWHWHHAGATVQDIISAGRSRIIHVHVSDAKAQPPEDVRDSQRLMPGEGVIDLVGFFKALQTIGYDDGVSPEPLGRVPAEMSAEEGAKLGLDTTLAVMKKAGVI